jgi:hypothetical protein
MRSDTLLPTDLAGAPLIPDVGTSGTRSSEPQGRIAKLAWSHTFERRECVGHRSGDPIQDGFRYRRVISVYGEPPGLGGFAPACTCFPRLSLQEPLPAFDSVLLPPHRTTAQRKRQDLPYR